jgi:hypothetical protein
MGQALPRAFVMSARAQAAVAPDRGLGVLTLGVTRRVSQRSAVHRPPSEGLASGPVGCTPV